MSGTTQGAQDDAKDSMAQPSSPKAQIPAPHPTHDQSASMAPAPVILDFLAQYYRTGEYADLWVLSNGVIRLVHKIIVCSQSPVIKHKCSCRPARRDIVVLDEYDPETVERVLDFCYRRTYSDGEYPEAVAPFFLQMTADDVCDALKAPLAILSGEESRGWTALCSQCDNSEKEESEGEIEEEGEGETEEGGEGETEEEGEDEYLPDRCEIDCSSADESESSDNETPPVNTQSESKSPTTPPQPPYPISLFINLKVYNAAKELQIPALQLLARERFAHSLRSHWARFSDLPTLIEQVYLRTDSSDHLRSLICQIVAAEYQRGQRVDFKVKVRELMIRNGEFAADVLDAVLRLGADWADMD